MKTADIHPGDQRVFVRAGKGGAERIVPVVGGFFVQLADYLRQERPSEAVGDHVFVVLKGPGEANRSARPD